MKAAIINQYGSRDELSVVSDYPMPELTADDVMVEIHATSINPIDYKAREGLLQGMYQWTFPVVLGWDVAGVITAIGDNVSGFNVGDRVFARPEIDPSGRFGSYAEYMAINANQLAKIPDSLSFEQAAAIPLAGETALQMLRLLDVKAGSKVLIQAGAGGVGTFAIQLAKQQGAFVATTVSDTNISLVKSLGADVVIDYHQEAIQDVLHDYDAVLDSVGDIDNGLAVLKDGGHLVTISAQLTPEQLATPNKKVTSGWLQPTGADLQILADAVTNHDMQVILDNTYPLTTEGIRAAHERIESHHARGKIIIQVKESDQ